MEAGPLCECALLSSLSSSSPPGPVRTLCLPSQAVFHGMLFAFIYLLLQKRQGLSEGKGEPLFSSRISNLLLFCSVVFVIVRTSTSFYALFVSFDLKLMGWTTLSPASVISSLSVGFWLAETLSLSPLKCYLLLWVCVCAFAPFVLCNYCLFRVIISIQFRPAAVFRTTGLRCQWIRVPVLL